MNSPFSMVVAIVFIGCVYSVITHWIDSRAKVRADKDTGASDETLELIGRLEHRIEVLERIVTDEGNNLKREIDRL
ncbi:MAG: hypothetical protein AAFO81_03955 [Pseudomonadota bacterium]